MQTTDFEVAVLAPPPENGGIGKYADQLCERMPEEGDIFVRQYPLFEGMTAREYVRSVHAAATADVVHVQFEYGFFRPFLLYVWIVLPLLFVLSWRRNTPVVVTVHEVWTPDTLGTIRYSYVWIVHGALCFVATRLVFMTREADADFRPRRLAKTSRIAHGVDVDGVRDIDPSTARATLGTAPDDIIVSQIGYVSPRKGTETFLALASRHPDYQFVLAGGPLRSEDRPYFRRMARGTSDNVRITGVLSDEEFHRAFVATDIAVLAYRDIRQSGILNWCFAYGVPVVCRAIPRFGELADEGAPLVLFDEDDPTSRSIDEALEIAVSERNSLAREMRAFGRSNAFSTVCDQYRRLYRDVAA